MFATMTTAAAATAALQMQPAKTTGVSSPNSRTPVLFAVPAPRAVGKELMCLCRKLYWTNGTLMYCAYAPVTKEEAAVFLKDPSIINVLSNPVTGANLLTVSPNGAIIGVQQTVGFLQPPSEEQQKSTASLKKTPSVGKSKSPQVAQKAPLKSPDLPKPTTTPSKAQKPVGNEGFITTTTDSMMPKINAVFTLAESGLNLDTLNAAKVASCKNTPETVLKDPVSQQKRTEHTTPVQESHQTVTTDSVKLPNNKITDPYVPKQVTKESVHLPEDYSSRENKNDNVSSKPLREGNVNKLESEPNPLQSLKKTVENLNLNKDKEPVQTNKQVVASSTEQPRKAQADAGNMKVKLALLIPNHSKNEDASKMSTESDSCFGNLPTTNAKRVPPIVLTKNSQGPGFVASLANAGNMGQKKQVNSAKVVVEQGALTSQSARNAPATACNNQSKVLSDVQNKVCHNQEKDSPTRGIKRKTSSVKTGETLPKKRKNVQATPSECPPLKVKFSWTKRWTVEGGETYFKYEPDFKRTLQTDNFLFQSDEEDPEITFKFEDVREDKGKKNGSKSTKAAQTDTVNKHVTRVVKPTVQVKLAEETVVVNNPSGYQFTCDYAKDKLVSINHKIPHLTPVQKLSRKEAIRLGCSLSCPLLPAKVKTPKKQQRKPKVKVNPPGRAPTLDTLTKNPDFHHISTGDKVAYLKELLRMQRAALGLSL